MSVFIRAMASAVLVTAALAAPVVTGDAARATAADAAALPDCPFFTDVVPPDRPVTAWVPPLQQAPPLDLAGRLPVPANIHGTLSGGQVTVTFDRVPGARAYRVMRNGQSVNWISDWGQPALVSVDTAPCLHAFYSVVAMSDESGADRAYGVYSPPLRLGDDGMLAPFSFPAGTSLRATVTSYNDGGQTASGYTTRLGICATDPRVIPWGTRFTVPGYGACYAADIGLWIQGNTVDVWLPGDQANGWGVQSRDLTFG